MEPRVLWLLYENFTIELHLQPAINIYVPMNLPALDISHTENHMIRDPLCLASLTQYNIFRVHQHWWEYQYFILFYDWLKYSIIFVLFLLTFWDRVLLCSPGWSQTHNLPASTSRVVGLQACATMPCSLHFILISGWTFGSFPLFGSYK
jgi:hypothetical protein